MEIDILNEKLNSLIEAVDGLSNKVNEIHAVQTAYNFKLKVKKQNRKQLEQEEDLRAIQYAHRKKLNN